jgi:glycosyltransferase involved in cell wall biosynthesis
MADVRTLAIVVPVYNEADAVGQFHARLCCVVDQLGCSTTVYYVDDGSTDATREVLHELEREDSRVCVLELTRNFGHQAALIAGIEAANADVIVTMDGDGQHPPELIPRMLELIGLDYEVVLTQRLRDPRVSGLKHWTSNLFYALINRLSDTHIVPGSADYRAMTRDVAATLKDMREYHKFLRGMIAWTGYRVAILPFAQGERLGGSSKYSLVKMVRLANAAVFSFSLVPVQLVVGLGGLFVVLAVVEALYVLSLWLLGQRDVLAPGWSSLMFVLLFVGGTITVSLGILGIYVGYIFQEVKRRPVYIVRSRQSLGAAAEPEDSDV